MNHIRNVLRGVGFSINPLGYRSRYVRPANGGFVRDFVNLSNDWKVVGGGLKANSESALREYVEPTHYSTGQVR
jgi:hypothetical protein